MATHQNSLLDSVPAAARSRIQQLVDDILRSAPFRTSRQCQDMFRFVVEHSLAGSEESLRERIIGMEVFGRAADYDTAADPVVRLRAADVRKRLAQYYQSRKSEPGDWTIDIPTGSYKAQFHRSGSATAQVPAPGSLMPSPAQAAGLSVIDSSASSDRRIARKRLWLLAALATCLAVVLVYTLVQAKYTLVQTKPRPTNSLDLFWGPVLENPRPVLVCTGSNSVYLLSRQALDKYKKTHSSPQDASANLERLVPPEDLKNFTGADFFPLKDTYLTLGDAWATAQISSLLTSHQHPFDLRFGNDLSFGDLRQGSAILIGAFNNSWTLNMTDNLRFVFESGDSPQMHIQDRVDRSRSWWPKGSQGNVAGDYAIVSRILESKTGGILVIIAGLNHEGTRAAGEFATNPQLDRRFCKEFAQGLEQKESTGSAPHRRRKWHSESTEGGCGVFLVASDSSATRQRRPVRLGPASAEFHEQYVGIFRRSPCGQAEHGGRPDAARNAMGNVGEVRVEKQRSPQKPELSRRRCCRSMGWAHAGLPSIEL